MGSGSTIGAGSTVTAGGHRQLISPPHSRPDPHSDTRPDTDAHAATPRNATPGYETPGFETPSYETLRPDTVGHLRLLSASGVRLDLDGVQVWVDGRRVQLPRKEFELLSLLMRNAGKVLSRREILDQVWGTGYAEGNKTLEVHVRRVRRKIEPRPHRPVRIRTVRGIGYIFDLTD
jgi:DNA-binding response OmpR family regulator